MNFIQSLELLWNKERQLYTEQLQSLEQSLIESKKLAIDQQTQIMQLTVQLESTEGQSQAQVCLFVFRKSKRFEVLLRRNVHWILVLMKRTKQY